MRLTRDAEEALIEIFMHVADAVDGGDPVPKGLKNAYLLSMKKKGVIKLYRDLVIANPFNKLMV